MIAGWGLLAAPALILAVDQWVEQLGQRRLVESSGATPAEAILVPGAYVHPRRGPSDILRDRLDVALELYRQGKAPRLLLSGDHQRPDYDEVGGMRAYLEARGVPSRDLFLDHAGLDTYDSVYRARHIFGARRLLIVTQRFQLVRALYIAGALGLEAQGVASDLHRYLDAPALRRREWGARCKALWEVWRRRPAQVGGEAVSLLGDGRETHRTSVPP